MFHCVYSVQIMQEQNVFDELKFREKFQSYLKNGSERIDTESLGSLLAQFNLDQPTASIMKVMAYFSFFSKQKMNRSIIREEEKQEDEQQKQGEEQAEPANGEDEQQYLLSIDEVLKYAQMLRKKIKFSLWKKTAEFMALQEEVFRISDKKYFALKDPGHKVKVNVVVGEQLQIYKSRAHIKIQKKSMQKSSALFHKSEDVWLAVKIITASLQESKKFGQLWKGMFELMETLSQQLPDGPEFIKTLQVVTEEEEKYLMIKVRSNNSDLNGLLITVVQFFDKIFKTEIRFILELFLDFNFDFGRLTQESSSLYEILLHNIRIRFNYRSTPFITALKELMIANNAFEGLSYVSDDSETLALIGFISAYQCDANIRFKNPNISNCEQQTLKQVLSMMMKCRSLLQEIGEGYPEFKSMIENVMKNRIEVEAQILSVFISADLYLEGLDHLVMDQSPLMEGFQNNDD